MSKERDQHLQELVTLMGGELLDTPVGITLTTGGGVISGALVSQERYFELWREQLMSMAVSAVRREVGDEAADNTEETLNEMMAEVFSFETVVSPEEDEGKKYIHLKDARAVTATGKVPSSGGEGMLWRGKISDVEGFSLGVLR